MWGHHTLRSKVYHRRGFVNLCKCIENRETWRIRRLGIAFWLSYHQCGFLLNFSGRVFNHRLSEGLIINISLIPLLILFSLLIMMDVVPLSAFLSTMALSCMRQLLFECFYLTGCERFLKPQKAELVDSSQISHKMDVAHLLYRNICTGGAFVLQRD